MQRLPWTVLWADQTNQPKVRRRCEGELDQMLEILSRRHSADLKICHRVLERERPHERRHGLGERPPIIRKEQKSNQLPEAEGPWRRVHLRRDWCDQKEQRASSKSCRLLCERQDSLCWFWLRYKTPKRSKLQKYCHFGRSWVQTRRNLRR